MAKTVDQPGNCRWETIVQQQRNTSTNRYITIDGVTMCAKEWAIEYGIKYTTFLYRIKRGMNPKEAITRPVRANRD